MSEDSWYVKLCRECPGALSMLIAREVVPSAMKVAQQKKSELIAQPASSFDETPDPDSSATSTPGIGSLNVCF